MLSRFLVLISVLLLSACEAAKEPEALHETEAPVGQLDNNITPQRYRLELTIDPAQPSFSGQTEIDINVAAPTSRLWLHGKDLSISSATITQAGRTVTASWDQVLESGVASLTTESPLARGDATIRIAYSAAFNRAANALYSVQRGEEHYAATQFQPIAARQAFPSFDEPRFKVPFDITILAKPTDVVVTATPETAATPEGDLIRHVFQQTRPLPTYLLAFVVGPYDVVTYDDIPPNTIRSNSIPLRGLAAKGQGPKLEYALQHTAGLLSILEEYFAIPYPYEKIDLIATPAGFGGAMENVGAIIYDEWLLLLEENSAIDQKRAYYVVHAHELAHMWFGNLVTPDWWTDIWLNESFATWASYKAAAAYWPEGGFDKSLQRGALGAMSNDSLANAREIREIVKHNDRISDSFDGITYRKGGGVLGMIENYAGEAAFREGIRHHMRRFPDTVANAPQFMASLAEGAELSEIEPIFASFISQAGVPNLYVEMDCTEQPTLNIKRTRYSPLGSDIDPASGDWQLPVCVSLYEGDARRQSCQLMTEVEQTFELGGSCPDFVFPNANGSGYYHFSFPEAQWQKQINNALALRGDEALSLVSSLDAAFRSGSLSGELYIRALATLINHNEWEVVDNVTGYLEALTDVISVAGQPQLRAGFAAIAAERYAGALAEGPQVLVNRLQRFMLILARDPALRAPLRESAAAYIGFAREADRASVNPGQLETTLSIGVQDLGLDYFEALLTFALAEQDPFIRSSALRALARAEDPAQIARLQATVAEGRLKGTESASIMNRQMARTASKAATFEWLKSDPIALMSLLPETFRSIAAPSFARSLCSPEKVKEWQAILDSNRELFPGYERRMQQVVESNALCAALREQSEAGLLAGLRNLSG